MRRRVPAAMIVGGILVGLVVLTALVSFVWTPHDPTFVDGSRKLAPPGGNGGLLGADKYGRDVASQLMVGARTTLYVGIVAVGIAALAGIPLGVLAGMTARGWIAELVMRGSDLVFAFPALLLAIMLGALYTASTLTAMIAIGVATVPAFVRIARAATLRVMRADYVAAARTAGRGGMAIAVRHVLPNIAGVLIVQASVSFAIAILAEAALSFLGFGTRPPTPSWGRMLQESQDLLFTAPRLELWPGLAIALTVLGFNLLGDGLSDHLDPKLRGALPGRAARDRTTAPGPGGTAPEPVDRPADAGGGDAVLDVTGLTIGTGEVSLVRDVSFTIRPGERVGLIGESGTGKSLTALAALGLLPRGLRATGSVRLAGLELVGAPERAVAALRGKTASVVFQEPMTALNPTMRVDDQVAETMLLHDSRLSRRAARTAAAELLERVDLPGLGSSYPHQLSGGQRQRVVLAIALAADPALLICDEPTTALDVSVQKRIVDLIVSLSAERGTALLFISHDLALVSGICDRIMVMYGGRVVEAGSAPDVVGAPRHRYTEALLGVCDATAVDENGRFHTIPGSAPAPADLPAGCPFCSRCQYSTDECATEPALTAGGHAYACWNPAGKPR